MNALSKILVVDDDPVVSKSFDRVLSAKGYVVVSARDGAEALQKIRDEEYDVVFTDIRMPGMDGIEVAEHIKARRPWTPVVIVTGYGSEASEDRAKAAGVSEFLHKPLSPEMIEGSTLKALHEKASAPAVLAAAATIAEAIAEPPARHSVLRDVGMLVAAPFIGLAFVMLMPLIGLAALAWFAGKAAMRIEPLRKVVVSVTNVALFLAAPFIGLAYLILGPIFGLAALAWLGARTLMKRGATH